MALIEGVGDEVTILFALLLILLVLVLAWVSTQTSERGDQVFAASPPLAAGQLGAESLLEDGPREPSMQTPAAGERKEEAESSAGAVPDGPDGIAAELRHRANPGSPQCPLQPPGDTGASPEAMDSSPTDRTIVLRLKFLNDTERLATVCPEETVGSLKRAHFPGQEHQVRLIYQGQLLRDDAQSLAALHLTHNSVLHCHVSQHGPAPTAAGLRATADPVHTALNVGSLMLPLFVLMLAVLWYFQLQYRHVFTATATSCLAGLTLLFSFMAFALYRR
ncbi:transmembrane and ubiquitin-like domain-containing protein 1 [Malaclemys terrapin pileata]|uniref:transmembrane and ubiquitin-like domain-containing protein 1 n=1 Tax=Malaclemys terrapin pileata TaxID=2991368 RepID=UPI0023A90088|nr:transmembrane and ubiquitin-like domain-containing protein 1 [Malaclemys terrapin pileata]XP_053874363.1 transmembrane and ubiquitin-like domain-containing protein 1 [Malaclemys terrapin pileata]